MTGSMEWFAVRVRSNFERTASMFLRGKGYDEFLPTYRSVRRWSDRSKEIQSPLFPGYVFCRLDLQNRLPVLMSPGVIGIVGAGRMPLPVSEAEIEAVKAIVNSSLLASPWPFLRVGEQVEIIRGPLAGVEGLLLKFKNNYRLVVSVSLLRRSVAVEIDGDWARPVERGNRCLAAAAAR